MPGEIFIEDNVIRNRGKLGYGDSSFIRRCRAGRGFGIVDVVILPRSGPHEVVLIEAKRSASVDSDAKVIGQLLLYYAGVRHWGTNGLRLVRQFADKHRRRSRSRAPKLLKSLSGGVTPPPAAWAEFQEKVNE